MGRLLSWALDIIVVLLLARAVLRMLFGGSRTPQARQPRRPPERLGGTLVRDPHCGTYVPESSAIRVGSGDRALYFCSTACRDAYAAVEAKRA